MFRIETVIFLFKEISKYFSWLHSILFQFSLQHLCALKLLKITNYCGRRQWHPTPLLLPGKSHGRRSLVGCSPWGREESDMTEWLHFQFSLSCIGEGNGNPLQCSCLENPRAAEPGGLPSMGLHRVGHDWSDLVVVVNNMQWCLFCGIIWGSQYILSVLKALL